MDKRDCFTIFLLCVLAFSPEVYATRANPCNNNKLIINNQPYNKLFVFGDSYADTGNSPHSSRPWRPPYGATFPGQPSGRWSDGRVITDYIASYMRIGSPIPYGMWGKDRGGDEVAQQHGINFAFGGTGVFDTDVGPNMTTQINCLQQLIQQNVYTKHDLSSSVAVLVMGGNDYRCHAYLENKEDFARSFVRQLGLNLKRIHGMGISKVAVTTMEPMGCLPAITFLYGFSKCNETTNNLMKFHNKILKQTVDKLNQQMDDESSPFVILDLYDAFISSLNIQNDRPGNSSFAKQLQPCCIGQCGEVDEKGEKKYKVCDDPKMCFFWDFAHPTQQAWFAVYSALKPSLQSLLHHSQPRAQII